MKDTPELWPADVYLEGADQYRGWFQSSLLTSVGALGHGAPFKQVLTHGWTVDGQGRAMHKSLGNGIDPADLIKEYGADIVRLWAGSADYHADVRCSKEIFKQLSQSYLKFRNTARYCLGNLNEFDPDNLVAPEDMEELDRWALTRLDALVQVCRKAYDNYEFHVVSHAINDFCVVELSSFQLMTLRRSPGIAVLTNLAPNHLDVHTDMAEYVQAKANIFTHQDATGLLAVNGDNDLTRALAEKAPGQVSRFTRDPLLVPERGCFIKAGTIWYRDGERSRPVLPLSDILLPGVHNVENYMAAVCAVQGLVEDETIRTFARSFGGVEHRIELCRERRGVRWYNDSIASSPSRTMAGLRSFPEKVILIAGGKDKGVSYGPLGPVINDHVKCLILCGATAGAIRRAAEEAENFRGLEILEAEDYPAAVALADSRAKAGDVVLLSPASTSFDRFKNFEERGRTFKALVEALPE